MCPGRPPPWVAVVVLVMMAVPLAAAGVQEPEDVGDVDVGREVFANHCATCHGPFVEGRGVAHSLLGVYERHTVEEIATTIRQGRDRMPAFGATLSDRQIDDVMAYLTHAPDEEAEPRHEPHMPRWWDDMMWDGAGGVFMVVWMIFGLLLIVLVVVGIVWLVRQVSSDGARSSDHQRPSWSGPTAGSAREDLDRRYARGEISREEYRTIRDDLEG
jgi:putative membrane protein